MLPQTPCLIGEPFQVPKMWLWVLESKHQDHFSCQHPPKMVEYTSVLSNHHLWMRFFTIKFVCLLKSFWPDYYMSITLNISQSKSVRYFTIIFLSIIDISWNPCIKIFQDSSMRGMSSISSMIGMTSMSSINTKNSMNSMNGMNCMNCTDSSVWQYPKSERNRIQLFLLLIPFFYEAESDTFFIPNFLIPNLSLF